MLVTLSGIVTEAKLVQSENANLPILVTPSGITTEFKFLQYLKVQSAMLVILLESITAYRSHPRNASLPILVTLFGIITKSVLPHLLNAASPIVLTPSCIVNDVTLTHPSNAELPILVTLPGIVIAEDKHLQSLNAS